MRDKGANVSGALTTVADMIRAMRAFPQDALISFDGTINYPAVELETKEDHLRDGTPVKIVTLVCSLWCRK